MHQIAQLKPQAFTLPVMTHCLSPCMHPPLTQLVCLPAIFTHYSGLLKQVTLYSNRECNCLTVSPRLLLFLCTFKPIKWPRISFPWQDWTHLHGPLRSSADTKSTVAWFYLFAWWLLMQVYQEHNVSWCMMAYHTRLPHQHDQTTATAKVNVKCFNVSTSISECNLGFRLFFPLHLRIL